MTDELQKAQVSLIEKSKKDGFLLFDDIFNISQEFNLSISDTEYLTNFLLEKNIIIQEKSLDVTIRKEQSENDFDVLESEYEDFAQLDYDAIFEEIVAISPVQKNFVGYVRKIVPPQRRELQFLQYQVLEKNTYARTRMIEMHLRQALKAALYFCKTYEQDMDDMISFACEGLIVAVDNYKPDSNGAFSSYASMWIMQMIYRKLGMKNVLMRCPAHFIDLYLKFLKEWKYFFTEDEIKYSYNFFCRLAGILETSINTARKVTMAFYQLENFDNIYDVETDKFRNHVREVDFIDVDYDFEKFIVENMENLLIKEKIETVLETIPKREKEVLKFRYGFDGEMLTLEEVGRYYNVTRERIRQIESKALKRLRHPRHAMGLLDYFDSNNGDVCLLE